MGLAMRCFKLTFLTVLAFVAFSPLVYANVAEPAGFVIAAQGSLTAVDQNGKVRELTRRSQFYANETLKTGDASQAQLRFKDRALMTLKPNSELNIGQYHFGGAEDPSNTAVMKLVAGGFRTISGSIGKSNKSAYRIETPAASIGIRGTDYELIISIDGKVFAAVHAGGITLVNDLGDLDLGSDSSYLFAEVSSGSSPMGLDQMPDIFKVEGGEKKELSPEQKAKLQQKLAEKQEKLQGILTALTTSGNDDRSFQEDAFGELLRSDNTINPNVSPDVLDRLKSGDYSLLVDKDSLNLIGEGRSVTDDKEGKTLFLDEESGKIISFNAKAYENSGHKNVFWGQWNQASALTKNGLVTIEQDVIWMNAVPYDIDALIAKTGNVELNLSGFTAASSSELVSIGSGSGSAIMDFTNNTINASIQSIVSAQNSSVGDLTIAFNGALHQDGELNNNFDGSASFFDSQSEQSLTLPGGVIVKGTVVAPENETGNPGFAGFFDARLPYDNQLLGVVGMFTFGAGQRKLLDKPSFMR